MRRFSPGVPVIPAFRRGTCPRLEREYLAAFAADMSELLTTSELTEAKAFVRSFVKSIVVSPGRATINYTIPMPDDSPIRSADRAEIDLGLKVRNTVPSGGRWRTRTSDLPGVNRTL